MPVIHQITGFVESNVVAPQDTGWVNLNTFGALGAGTRPWSFHSNAQFQDGTAAVYGGSFSSASSDFLAATDINIPPIPGTSTIDGIRIRYLPAALDKCYEFSVRLVVGGALAGADRGVITRWPGAFVSYITRGSAVDLWGLTPTASDINASNFGWAIQSITGGDGPFVPDIGLIDHMQIRINYTA